VYTAVATTKPFTMSDVSTVYGIRELSMKSRVASQPSPRPSPPMHGTSKEISWTVPSGVVSLNVPPEKAQIVESSADFASRAW
jgi:hypothetical protein